MKFEVNQKIFTIRDKFQVSIDGDQVCSIASSPISLLPKFTIYNSDGREVACIEKEFTFFKAHYRIKIEGVGHCSLYTDSFWRCTFKLETPSCNYEVLGHKKRKYSIFHNKFQVAMFQKNMISIGDGDTYFGEANCNENYLLVICTLVALDNYFSSNSDRSTITIDLGNFLFEKQPYDKNWTPSA